MRTVKEPELRKQELIETALRLFLKKGYEKTSVRDILREVKGSPGMFYYYFSSKEAIFEEAIQYYVENSTKDLFQIFKKENLSFQEKYNEIVNTVIKIFEDIQSMANNLSNSQYFPLRVKLSFKILEKIIKPFSELIGDIKKDKNLDPQKTSIFILYGVYGLLRQEAEVGNREKISQLIHYIIEITGKILGFSSNL